MLDPRKLVYNQPLYLNGEAMTPPTPFYLKAWWDDVSDVYITVFSESVGYKVYPLSELRPMPVERRVKDRRGSTTVSPEPEPEDDNLPDSFFDHPLHRWIPERGDEFYAFYFGNNMAQESMNGTKPDELHVCGGSFAEHIHAIHSSERGSGIVNFEHDDPWLFTRKESTVAERIAATATK